MAVYIRVYMAWPAGPGRHVVCGSDDMACG